MNRYEFDQYLALEDKLQAKGNVIHEAAELGGEYISTNLYSMPDLHVEIEYSRDSESESDYLSMHIDVFLEPDAHLLAQETRKEQLRIIKERRNESK